MNTSKLVILSVILILFSVTPIVAGPADGETVSNPLESLTPAADPKTIEAPVSEAPAATDAAVVPAAVPAASAAPVTPVTVAVPVVQTASQAQVPPVVEASPTTPVQPPPAATPAPQQVTTVALPGFAVPANLEGNNYCGQYAMTSILKAMGGNVDFRQIYRDSNPQGIFTAPTTIIEYLTRVGCAASLRNRASSADIRAKLDAGKPVIVLVTCSGTPHWVAISGYKKDAAGNILSYELRDSVWGVNAPNGAYDMPAAEFERIWSTPLGSGFLGSTSDYGNLMVDIGSYTPGQNNTTPIFPGNFGTSYEDAVAGGINDVVGGWRNGSPASVVSGSGKLITAVPATILTVPGRGIRNGGSAVIDDASDRWNRGGVLNGTAAVGEWAAGGLMYGTGATLNAGGQVISATGNVVGNGLKKTGNFISNTWHSIWN